MLQSCQTAVVLNNQNGAKIQTDEEITMCQKKLQLELWEIKAANNVLINEQTFDKEV